MKDILSRKSPFRIFAFSSFTTIILVFFTCYFFINKYGLNDGVSKSLPILLTLVVIEITFSFENAIINSKVLTRLNKFWQNMFLTIGILIAIFGMRIIFPIAIVCLATGLGWREVLNLAINDPNAYSKYLEEAYPLIAGFGGAFLTMLGLNFFMDKNKKINWFKRIEKKLISISGPWMPAIITAGIIGLVALIPHNQHQKQTLVAGAIGIVTFIVIHGLSEYFGNVQQNSTKKNKNAQITGFAGLLTFLYLELLDASFSLDGVIGAFAITNQVILIAMGLGIGAIWVRSMTVFMVRNGTLNDYQYLEHGAHYTVLVLALTMFLSEIFHVPEAIAGVLGIVLILSSIIYSRKN